MCQLCAVVWGVGFKWVQEKRRKRSAGIRTDGVINVIWGEGEGGA